LGNTRPCVRIVDVFLTQKKQPNRAFF
jgi:hypothetical protein